MDTVLNLQEEKWETLSTDEKLSTIQTIANIEANFFGLPHELTVKLKTLGENTIAHYNDLNHSITLNIDYFDSYSASETLESLCHEAFHAYQHRLCDAYDSVDDASRNLLVFQYIQQYKNEFDNYIRGKDDFGSYYALTCESSAREYAEDGVEKYYNYIEKYLTETVKNQP